jgi:hypothetical protein
VATFKFPKFFESHQAAYKGSGDCFVEKILFEIVFNERINVKVEGPFFHLQFEDLKEDVIFA